MPKKSKGKRGGKKGKKKGKSKSKKKKQVTAVPPPPPEPDTFIWVRRKTTSILVESHEEMTVPELKELVAGIVGKPVDQIGLFKDKKELEDFKKVKEEKKDAKQGRGGASSRREKEKKSKSKSKSKSKGKKGKKGDDKSKGPEKEKKAPEPDPMKVVEYGFNATTSSILNPGTIALVYRDEENPKKYEPIEITPWMKAQEIPASVKPFLRNYTGMLGFDETQQTKTNTANTGKKGSGGNNNNRRQ